MGVPVPVGAGVDVDADVGAFTAALVPVGFPVRVGKYRKAGYEGSRKGPNPASSTTPAPTGTISPLRFPFSVGNVHQVRSASMT
jgi:hypothetical protein